MAGSLESIFNVIMWAIILAFLVINLVTLRVVTRPIAFTLGNHNVTLFFDLIAFVAYLILIKAGASYSFAIVFAIGGLVLGLASGMISKVYQENDIVYLKRSAVAPAITLAAYTISIYFAAFGGGNLISFGILMVIAAMGLSIGASILEEIKATNY